METPQTRTVLRVKDEREEEERKAERRRKGLSSTVAVVVYDITNSNSFHQVIFPYASSTSQ